MRILNKNEGLTWLGLFVLIFLVTTVLSIFRRSAEIDYVANKAACQNQAEKVKATEWKFDPQSKECRYK